MKAKLIAFFVLIAGLFAFKQKAKAEGKSEQEAKANEVILENISKATKAVDATSDPDEYNRLRKKYSKNK